MSLNLDDTPKKYHSHYTPPLAKTVWCVLGYPGGKTLQTFADQIAAQAAMCGRELIRMALAAKLTTWELIPCLEEIHVTSPA